MDAPIVGGVIAFLAGAAVSVLNYFINRRTLEKKPDALASMSVVRQLLNIAVLVAAYLLWRHTPWGGSELLIGAALGVTLPAIGLSFLLAKQNDAKNAAQAAEAKGEDNDG